MTAYGAGAAAPARQLRSRLAQHQNLPPRSCSSLVSSSRRISRTRAGVIASLGSIPPSAGLRAWVDVGDGCAAGLLADLLAARGDYEELRARADAGDTNAAGRLAELKGWLLADRAVPMAFYFFGGWKDSLFGDTHVHAPRHPLLHQAKAITSRWPDNQYQEHYRAHALPDRDLTRPAAQDLEGVGGTADMGRVLEEEASELGLVRDIGYGRDSDAARPDALTSNSGAEWHAGARGSASPLGRRLRCSNGCSRDTVDRQRDPRRGETSRRGEQRGCWTRWTR